MTVQDQADGRTPLGDGSAALPAAPAGQGLGSRVGRGAAWGLLTNLTLRLGSLLSGIVVARVLSPADYGVYAIGLVALTLLQSFNELGVSLALVRWQQDVRRIAPTVMTIALTSSSLLYCATFLAAPAYCGAMGSPDAVGVLRLMCLSVIIDGLATVPLGLINRQFLQRRRFIGDAATFVTTSSVTITLALSGAGPASFAWGRVVGGLVAVSVYTALSPIRVRPGWDRTQVPPLLRFGLPLAGASLLVLSISNVDNLIVGWQTTPAELGRYLMAFNQASWPLLVFAEAARRVSLAGFSRLVDQPSALARSFSRGLALLMTATVPVCTLLVGYAEPLLRALYGDRWAAAATALPILALLGLARVGLFVCYDLFVALGRSRLLIGLHALWLVVLVPALVIGTRVDGIRGAAVAHVLVAGFLVVPAFGLALHRLGMRPLAAVAACGRPLLGGALVLATALLVRSTITGSWPQLLVGGPVALFAYAPVVWPMRQLLPGRAEAAAAAAATRTAAA